MAPTAIRNAKIEDDESLVEDKTRKFWPADKLKAINNGNQESMRGMRPLVSNKRNDPHNYEDQIQLPKRYKYIRLLGHGAYGMVW
jgi:hypothetical protein